jgi:hypothetical protein
VYVLLGLKGLGMDFVERRDAVVPLEKGRGRTHPADRMFVKLPHGVDHWMIVRVQDVLLKFGMSGDVDLCYTLGRNAVQIIIRIKIVISR